MLTEETLTYIRLLIGDQAGMILTDSELEALFSVNAGSVKRAAADALYTIATNEVLLSKKLTTQDLSTDGPAVANALMSLAARLRREADDEDAATGIGEYVGFAQYGPGPRVEGEEYRAW